MASLINIIIPLETFFDEFNSLIHKSAMHVYIKTRAGQRVTLKKVNRREDFLLKVGERYYSAYITSVEFLKERDGDIFDEEFCVHAIELRGGGRHQMKLKT